MSKEDRIKAKRVDSMVNGENMPPPAWQKVIDESLKHIVPRDRNGHPHNDGKIGFISVSMSNATIEFPALTGGDSDPNKAPSVEIVDCAQGDRQWRNGCRAMENPGGKLLVAYARANLSPDQVQVAWIKLANKSPTGGLSEHGRILERDTHR